MREVLDQVAVQARRIDHDARPDLAGLGRERPARIVQLSSRHFASAPDLRSVRHGLKRIGERCRPRVDDVLAGNQRRAERARSEVGLARVQLARGDLEHIGDAICMRLGDDTRKPFPLGFSPGNYDRTRLDQGKVEPVADLQVLRIAGLAIRNPQPGRGGNKTYCSAGASTPNNKIGDVVVRILATRGLRAEG